MNDSFRMKKYNSDDRVSIICLMLCGLLVIVLGCLPAVPSSVTRLLRPIFIAVFVLVPCRKYLLGSMKWQIIFLVYLFVIFVMNPVTGSSTTAYISNLLFGFFAVFAASKAWTKREIKLIVTTIIFSSIVFSAIVLYENRNMISGDGNQHIFFLGTSFNRNTAAFSAVPGAMCAMIALLYDRKVMHRLINLFGMGICMLLIVATACRSAFLAVVVGAALVFWQFAGERKKYVSRFKCRTLTAIAFVLVLLIMSAALKGTNSERLFDLTDDSGRDELWDEAWQLIDEKPAFGGGYDYWENTGHTMGTHNTFLTFMIISGYTGGAFLLIFLLAITLECVKTRHFVPLAFLTELFCHTYTEPGMDYYAYIPMILALIFARYIKNVNCDLRTIFGN